MNASIITATALSILPVPCLCAEVLPATLSPEDMSNHLDRANGAMKELITILRQLRHSSQPQTSLPALAAVVQRYHDEMQPLFECPDIELPPLTAEYRDFHRRHREILRRRMELEAEMSHIFDYQFLEQMREQPLLTYHLLMQTPYLELPLSDMSCEMLVMQLAMQVHRQHDTTPNEPEKKLFVAAAERHRDFMATHSEQFSGGDGSTCSQAIILHCKKSQPGTEAYDNEQNELIRNYLRTVYPQECVIYNTCMARPDGSFYIIPVRFAGLSSSSDGSQHLIRQAIWFLTVPPKVLAAE